ncbi:hypothetical protein SEA_TELESWORLD_79 [Mycobacterium phage Telesworld]|nr:hypothetical protein SEA_TELESWORLD_79 [Mycobacterium phage Telesworld]
MWPDLADIGTVALVGSVAGALYPLTRVLLAHIDRRRARDNRHPEDEADLRGER